jgi:hypothetical protein
MELCRRFKGGPLGKFSLIDTPVRNHSTVPLARAFISNRFAFEKGPDEAMQGHLLYEKVEQVLRESDAVICVINGRSLKNNAQQSVQDLLKKQQKAQENVMVLINHMDITPKKPDEIASELKMRQSTAQSFLGNPDKIDLIHPSSAYQGLCNLQMNRLLGKIEAKYPERKQHKQGQPAYDELLMYLQEEEQYTASFVKDWVFASHGPDGLPESWFDEDGELDEDDAPNNLLVHVKKKNDARWAQSRLEIPMRIVSQPSLHSCGLGLTCSRAAGVHFLGRKRRLQSTPRRGCEPRLPRQIAHAVARCVRRGHLRGLRVGHEDIGVGERAGGTEGWLW